MARGSRAAERTALWGLGRGARDGDQRRPEREPGTEFQGHRQGRRYSVSESVDGCPKDFHLIVDKLFPMNS